MALLNKLKAGASPRKPMQSGYKCILLVDYLKSVKNVSDYISRSKYSNSMVLKIIMAVLRRISDF